MAKSLLRTRKVGSPHASTSWASGKWRQSWRTRGSGEERGMPKPALAGRWSPAIRLKKSGEEPRSGPKTTDRKRRAENGGPKTTDRERRTENSGGYGRTERIGARTAG